MLITSFLIFLVFSSLKLNIISDSIYNILINRLGIITICFILFLFILSINLIPLIPGYTLYNNWLNITSLNYPFIILILILIISLLIYNTTDNSLSLNSRYARHSRDNSPEGCYYLLLILANIIGLLLLPLINDLLALYIIIELQSYSLYLLTGLHNRSFNASKASLLYYIIGSITSSIILLSLYYIYWITGSTNLTDIIIYNSFNPILSNLTYSFDILIISLFFKMGLAPLHKWSISVYNYTPTYITAYISIVAKISIIGLLYNNNIICNSYIILIFYYISLFIGAYKPLNQINIKIILAYSGILNFGYILLALILSDISLYIYIIQYLITHIIIFLIILASSQYNYSISKWSPIIYIQQLKLPNKTLSYCFILSIFSLIGIPPLAGFYGKLNIISSALLENYILEIIILIISNVIASYYYINIIKITMYSNTKLLINYINPLLAYTISSFSLLLLTFYIYISYISEGLYLIII